MEMNLGVYVGLLQILQQLLMDIIRDKAIKHRAYISLFVGWID
jgi:hypothetical protein